MNIATRPADIYFRFLQLVKVVRGLPSLPPLDPRAERLLGRIANASQAQARLSVRDMLAKSELGSPAMIHTCLKSMRAKGWVLLADTEDARRKQIELAPDALRYFDGLSGFMLNVAQGSKGGL